MVCIGVCEVNMIMHETKGYIRASRAEALEASAYGKREGVKGWMDKRRSEGGQGGEGVTVGDGGDENA